MSFSSFQELLLEQYILSHWIGLTLLRTQLVDLFPSHKRLKSPHCFLCHEYALSNPLWALELMFLSHNDQMLKHKRHTVHHIPNYLANIKLFKRATNVIATF